MVGAAKSGEMGKQYILRLVWQISLHQPWPIARVPSTGIAVDLDRLWRRLAINNLSALYREWGGGYFDVGFWIIEW